MLVEEERLRKDPAADGEVASVVRAGVAVLGDSPAHSCERRGAVGDAERLPFQAEGITAGVREDATAHDLVDWRAQLEQKQLARLERLEALVRRRPEVDFLQQRLLTQQAEPLGVRHCNNQLDCHGSGCQ
jgi:hypothetical protein